MTKVSVLIPAYKGGAELWKLVKRVLSDPYGEKEVIVVIDEPDRESLDFVDRLCGRVRFVLNEKRVGKAAALNQALAVSSGDVLLFLDADTYPTSGRFIAEVVEELEGYDVLDIKKVVEGGSLLQRMVYYEYLGFNVASWILSTRLGRVPGLNGACFATRRELVEKIGGIPYTISEDLDLGLLLARMGARFKYTHKLSVCTKAPETWEGWVRQRKRWAIGLGYWLKSNLRLLFKEFLSNPLKYLTSIILIFPSLIAGIVAAILGEPLLLFLQVSMLSLLLPISSGIRVLSIAFLPGSLEQLFTYLFSLLIGFAFGWAAFRSFSRKLGYEFRPLNFLLYILLYSPLWLAFSMYGIAMALLNRRPELDWVVGKP